MDFIYILIDGTTIGIICCAILCHLAQHVWKIKYSIGPSVLEKLNAVSM